MVHSIHDSGYRKLFSNTTIFRQLLETFVNQPWVKDIDFSTCTPLNRTFISNEYKERETDLIQKVKINGKDAYIYILIEFQSNVQKFMAVRVLHYITSLYIYYLENNKKVKKLPQVFPIILYNGDDKWTAPEQINELIENNISLGEYAINFKYFKIAENSFDKDFLLKAGNIVSTLFLTEAHFDIEIVKTAFEDLFDKEEDKQAIAIFFNWYEQFSNNNKLDSKDFDELAKVYIEKSEVKSMLSTGLEKHANRFKDQWKAEGIAEGIAEGKAQGKVEGKAEGKAEGIAEGTAKGKVEALVNKSIKLLSKKLGELPLELLQEINLCKDINKLDQIIDNIFDISSFDEVKNILNK